MNPGNRDILITVQQDTGATENAGGEHVENWVQYVKLWAAYTEKSSGENTEADELTGNVIATFNVRYYTGITQKMRILNGSDIYNILSVNPIGRHNELLIEAEKKDSGKY